MSVIRIEKTKDYTVMSNYHFREREMSLKAKGLLSLMLSLPEKWDYSIAGLVAICKENETSIKTALDELKDFGYLQVIKKMPNETKTGRIEYEYIVYEQKQEGGKQGVENLGVEIQDVEAPPQYKNNQLNTKKENTKTKHIYGEFKHIKLTDDELNKLKEQYDNWQDLIDYLDEAIEMKGYVYKSHYLAIKKWVVDAVNKKQGGAKKKDYGNEYDNL